MTFDSHDALPLPSDTGGFDLTDTAEKLCDTFRRWGVNYAMMQIVMVPGLQWLSIPPFSNLLRALIDYTLTLLTSSAEMEALFLAACIQKETEAGHFTQAVNARRRLTEKISKGQKVSNEDLENAETSELEAFRRFVLVSRPF